MSSGSPATPGDAPASGSAASNGSSGNELDRLRVHRAPPSVDRRVVELRIPADRRFHPTGRLVAGGLASRLGLDVDQMADVRLAVESILLQRPAAHTLLLRLSESPGDLHIRIGPFVPGAAGRPGLERVLAALVDESTVQRREQGDWIAFRVDRPSASRGGR